MASELYELEKAVAQLKADINFLEQTVETLKNNDGKLTDSVGNVTREMMELKISINNKFNNLYLDISRVTSDMSQIRTDFTKLGQGVERVESNVSKVSKNSLLEFTSDLDLKKTISLILIILSLVSSPSLITSWLSSSETPSSDKLDILIELLQEDKNEKKP